MASAHTVVKHELLVRLLDAWTPVALHSRPHVTYVEGFADRQPATQSSAAAALRVFGEFADLLERHTLTMVLGGTDPDRLAALHSHLTELTHQFGSPPGLTISVAIEANPATSTLLRGSPGSPVFGWFDGVIAPSGLEPGAPSGVEPGARSGVEPGAGSGVDWSRDVVSTVVRNKASEVLVAFPASTDGRPPSAKAGTQKATNTLPLVTATVDLVDESDHAERLRFVTPSEKSMETFKDELWALDEYAGIRYRDPHDPEHALLDISLQPHLGPLRRILTERLRSVAHCTLSDLRTWTLHGTVYRAGDAAKAVQSMVVSGAVAREPAIGRLSPDTVIRLVSG